MKESGYLPSGICRLEAEAEGGGWGGTGGGKHHGRKAPHVQGFVWFLI